MSIRARSSSYQEYPAAYQRKRPRASMQVVSCPGREFEVGVWFNNQCFMESLWRGHWPEGMVVADNDGRQWRVEDKLLVEVKPPKEIEHVSEQ